MNIAVAENIKAASAEINRKDLLRAVTNAGKIATKQKKGSEGSTPGSLTTKSRPRDLPKA